MSYLLSYKHNDKIRSTIRVNSALKAVHWGMTLAAKYKTLVLLVITEQGQPPRYKVFM